MSDYLPEEVLIKILSNLPSSSLIRCTSVCKLWYSLIKNPDFISNQIAKTSSIDLKTNPNPVLIFHLYAGQYSLGFDSQIQEFKEYISLPFPFRFGGRFLPAVGYSNGLLCLCERDVLSNKYKDNFILWNPSIRKSLPLPQPNFAFRASCSFCSDFMGFGFDSNTNDYKVFRMMLHRYECKYVVEEGEPVVQIEIYSVANNSWKIITDAVPSYYRIRNRMLHECPSQKHCVAAFLKNNNCLHWIVRCWHESEDRVHQGSYFIMVFDLKDEVFSEIMLPDFFKQQPVFGCSVKAYRELSISVVGRRNNSWSTLAWVMNEYGDEGSWEMLPIEDDQLRVVRTRILGFRNNGEIIFIYFRQQSQCPVEDAFVDNYVESLALLDKPN